jgi:hypothetical protein
MMHDYITYLNSRYKNKNAKLNQLRVRQEVEHVCFCIINQPLIGTINLSIQPRVLIAKFKILESTFFFVQNNAQILESTLQT